MSKYVCKYGLYHDREVKNGEPSSNNGWIYTAYANRLGLDINRDQIYATQCNCFILPGLHPIYMFSRLPGKLYPPLSRDEVLGMASLGFDVMIYYGWYMYKMDWKPDYIKAIKTLWRIRKEHRNNVWEQHHYEAFPLAFKLWHHDRYYINSIFPKRKPTIFQWIMFQLYVISTILQNNISAKNVCLLQLEDLNSRWWIRFFDKKKQYAEYFSEDHIFNNRRGNTIGK